MDQRRRDGWGCGRWGWGEQRWRSLGVRVWDAGGTQAPDAQGPLATGRPVAGGMVLCACAVPRHRCKGTGPRTGPPAVGTAGEARVLAAVRRLDWGSQTLVTTSGALASQAWRWLWARDSRAGGCVGAAAAAGTRAVSEGRPHWDVRCRRQGEQDGRAVAELAFDGSPPAGTLPAFPSGGRGQQRRPGVGSRLPLS